MPIFQHIEKVWVVLGDDNVSAVLKTLVRHGRPRDDWHWESDVKMCEALCKFEPYPLPNHTDKLNALTTCDADHALVVTLARDITIRERCVVSSARPTEPEPISPIGGTFEPWMLGGSGATGSIQSSTPIRVEPEHKRLEDDEWKRF